MRNRKLKTEIRMSDLTGQYLGQYQILARISKGSTSTIYKAYQAKLDRFVAVKVLSPHVLDEEGFLARFTQEARAVAQLDHPNIVPVYDFDQIGDIAYIVFKYVESGTLRSMMTGSPIDLSLVVDLTTQVALALGYAHRRGVIHRDVKPSNILIGEGRWAMLTDFGLAKILSGGKQLTKTGVGMGTPDYMSPEQAQGLPSDGRSDLYSLGATLYEMTTGHVPFEADSSMGVVVKHISEQPIAPRQFNPHLPVAVEKVILTVMAKDPSQRYQTAEAMVAALVRAASPAMEHYPASRSDLAALSLNRPRTVQSKPSPSRWQGIRAAGMHAAERFRGHVWNKLSLRRGFVIGGAILGAVVTLVLIGSIVSSPAHVAAPTRNLTPKPATLATATVSRPANTSTATRTPTTAPTKPASPQSASTPSATSEWTYLPPSATIRPGIYVKIVRPAGLDVSKEAGYEKEFVTTLPIGRIVYVVAGPVRANALNWIQVTDGVTTGWGVQDYVVPYGIKNAP